MERSRDPAPVAPGDGGGGHAAVWDAAAARQLAHAAPGLTGTLPRFPEDLPRTISVRQPERRAAVLAEAMLAEGLLRESDWCGTVRASIAAGMARWVDALGDLGRIHFGILWTDDLVRETRRGGGPGLDPRLWLSAVPGRNPEEPVGLLGLKSKVPEERYPEERDVCVGRTVLEFEALRPGLGYQLLNVLQEVLPPILCAAMPFWGYQQVQKADMVSEAFGPGGTLVDLGDRRLHLPQHNVTMGEFLAHVPIEACVGELRLGLVRRALAEKKGPKLPDRLREIAELAVEVLTRWGRYPKEMYFAWDTHSLCASKHVKFLDVPGGANVEGAFAVRWSPRDPMPRLVGDYLRLVRDVDDSTDLIWSRGWQAGSPDALRRSVREFRHVVGVAVKACQLAEAMHQDEPPPMLPGQVGRAVRRLIAPVTEESRK